jgi:hypothetical protein
MTICSLHWAQGLASFVAKVCFVAHEKLMKLIFYFYNIFGREHTENKLKLCQKKKKIIFIKKRNE